MNRTSWYVSLAFLLAVAVLSACTQASTPSSPPAEKPAEKAVVKPVEKVAEKPVEKPVAKPAEKAAEKPADKPAAAKPEQKPEARPAPKDLPANVALGTHPVGSSYNTTGAGVAKVASDKTPIKVTVKPFAGPNAWMPLMESGELQFGLLSGIDAGWAFFGGTGFDKSYKNLRLVMRGNEIPTIVLAARQDSGIKSLKDLRGKRVASEYGGNVAVREIVTAALESVGLTWNDVRQVPVTDLATGFKALREGRADATFGGSPSTAAALEVDAAATLIALDFGDLSPDQADRPPRAMIDRLRARMPGAGVIRQPKEGYLKSDATVYTHALYLAAGSSVGADAVYEIIKALYENDKELHPIHAWLKDWKQSYMFDPEQAAPYHDGAVRYWKEKGIWNSTADAIQKKLLGQ